MGHKVFVSYKYSDYVNMTVKYRDILMDSLKEEGSIYKGEDGYSDDLSSRKADSIKEILKPMIHDSTVTIVLISENIIQSKWVDWEIHYSLMDVTRKEEGRSRMNGVIGVLLPNESSSYDYYRRLDQCQNIVYNIDSIPKMIVNNRYNINIISNYKGTSPCGETFNSDYGSYISIYTWDDFINNLDNKIEIAFNKSRSLRDQYNINVNLINT